MEEYINQLFSIPTLVSITASILASFIFLLIIFYVVKPKLKIAPFIVEQTDDKGKCYRLKIVNKDYFFKLYEVQVQLLKCTIVNNANDVEIGYFKLINTKR